MSALRSGEVRLKQSCQTSGRWVCLGNTASATPTPASLANSCLLNHDHVHVGLQAVRDDYELPVVGEHSVQTTIFRLEWSTHNPLDELLMCNGHIHRHPLIPLVSIP